MSPRRPAILSKLKSDQAKQAVLTFLKDGTAEFDGPVDLLAYDMAILRSWCSQNDYYSYHVHRPLEGFCLMTMSSE